MAAFHPRFAAVVPSFRRVNVRDWLRVHQADGPLVLRIEEIKHYGPSQRLLCSAVRTGNITDEERALGVIEPVPAGSEPLDGGTY